MCDSWRKHFQVGIIHAMAYPDAKTDDEIIETMTAIVQDPFFGAIEIAPVEEHLVQRVKTLLEQSRMQTIYCASGMCANTRLDLCSPDSSQANAAVETLKPLIDQAYELGSKLIVIAGGPDPEPLLRDAARRSLVRSLRLLREHAQQKATDYLLNIAVETFDRDIEKGQLLGPTKEARELIEEAADGKPGFGLVLDLSHIPLVDETPTQAVVDAGEWLVHAHMGNCLKSDKSHPMYGDQHPRFGVPKSEVSVPQLAEYLRALRDTGYFSRRPLQTMPAVSFEVKPRADEHPLTLIASSKRTFMDAWASI